MQSESENLKDKSNNSNYLQIKNSTKFKKGHKIGSNNIPSSVVHEKNKTSLINFEDAHS
jgi:hypothetical protein